MLYVKPKKEAIAIQRKAVDKYNDTYKRYEGYGAELYDARSYAVRVIMDVELLVNSIVNCPKEFEKKIVDIKTEREDFKKTEDYAIETLDDAVKSGAGMVAGAAGGTLVAAVAPKAAMWVATTYGTASTGTAISSLSGIAAEKAALAWLGGGTVAVGGGGVAAGQSLLALAGPIGWGITGVTTAASVFRLGHANKKAAEAVMESAKKITVKGALLAEDAAKIHHLLSETRSLTKNLQKSVMANGVMKDADYDELTDSQQYLLGAMVNNTLALAQMINKKI